MLTSLKTGDIKGTLIFPNLHPTRKNFQLLNLADVKWNLEVWLLEWKVSASDYIPTAVLMLMSSKVLLDIFFIFSNESESERGNIEEWAQTHPASLISRKLIYVNSIKACTEVKQVNYFLAEWMVFYVICWLSSLHSSLSGLVILTTTHVWFAGLAK